MRPTSSLLSDPAFLAVTPHAPGFVAVGLDAEAFGRLCAALQLAGQGSPEIRRVAGSHDLEWAEKFDRPVAAVFDPFAEEPGLLRALTGHPCLRLVAYGRLTPACAERLGEVLRAGVLAFVTRDVDDTPAGFGYHLRRAGLLGA